MALCVEPCGDFNNLESEGGLVSWECYFLHITCQGRAMSVAMVKRRATQPSPSFGPISLLLAGRRIQIHAFPLATTTTTTTTTGLLHPRARGEMMLPSTRRGEMSRSADQVEHHRSTPHCTALRLHSSTPQVLLCSTHCAVLARSEECCALISRESQSRPET